MSTKFGFTQARLAKLPVPKKGRVMYRDTKTPGLCIRVTDRGAMSAYLSRFVKGRHVKYRLGRWPEDFGSVKALREAAEKALPELDTLPAKRHEARSQPTLGDLWACWEKYIEAHKRPKSQKEDRRQWETMLKHWARRRLVDIDRKAVANLHNRIGRERGKYIANRLLALLSAMFGEGERQGLCEANPCRGIRRFKEEKRDRYLDSDELRRFFEALKAEPQRDFFLLLLLTGARRSNVLAMRWEEIDWERALWRIPEAKGGQVVVVPLVEPALLILKARWTAKDITTGESATGNNSRADVKIPKAKDTTTADSGKGCTPRAGWVFPGRSRTGHLTDPMRAWRRICKTAGLENARPHDLRRTLGSWMAKDGAPILTIGKALGHKQLSTTEIYARLSVDPVREAVDRATGAMLEAGGNAPK